jgi:glycosyltransferase involved in cell wall biosynthesis
MKVLLVNTFSQGGAAKACIRLHLGLLKAGIDSKLLLLHPQDAVIPESAAFTGRKNPDATPPLKKRLLKKIAPSSVRFDAEIKAEIRKNVPHRIEWFAFPDTGYDISKHKWVQEADIINLHWVAAFLDYSFFQHVKKPVVWSMHDMNPFTGGCHYSGNCTLYTSSCEVCPQLDFTPYPEFSHRNFEIKSRMLQDTRNVTLAGLSQWMIRCAEQSALFGKFPAVHLPNGLDESVFFPENKQSARKKLNLPADKKIILFVTYGTLHTPRKGFALLLEALEKLQRDDVMLCAVGSTEKNTGLKQEIMEFGFIADEAQLRLIYSAADFFVIPSLQDNLPNTVIESLLCGTPVVGFATGGIPDMVREGMNGLLAKELTAESLFDAVSVMLNSLEKFNAEEINKDAVKRYSQQVQANRYIELFKTLLQKQTDWVDEKTA